MGYSDEEVQKFVEENRDIIEMLMARKESSEEAGAHDKERARRYRVDAEEGINRARERADSSRSRFEEDILWARDRADESRDRMEGAFRDTYEAFTDPEVQKHFMTMGLNFMMGMSALMQRMPGPDFMKDAASGMESSWKKASCSSNADCSARKRKIDIEDSEPSSVVPIKFEAEE